MTQNPEPQNLSLVLWVKLFKAVTKDVNGAWRMVLLIEIEDIADEENEQEFNVNQSEDEMSECESIVIAAQALEANKY